MPRLLALLVALAILLALIFASPSQPIISRWQLPAPVATAVAPAQPGAIVGQAALDSAALERYNAGSALQDADPDRRVRFYRRDLAGGGSIAYFVVMLDAKARVAVINADGATPGSDSAGDTIWTDGKRHLATAAEMAQAPYALRDGAPPLLAMAFGFHGDARTSDEDAAAEVEVHLHDAPALVAEPAGRGFGDGLGHRPVQVLERVARELVEEARAEVGDARERLFTFDAVDQHARRRGEAGLRRGVALHAVLARRHRLRRPQRGAEDRLVPIEVRLVAGRRLHRDVERAEHQHEGREHGPAQRSGHVPRAGARSHSRASRRFLLTAR